jgi:hypothetical protein
MDGRPIVLAPFVLGSAALAVLTIDVQMSIMAQMAQMAQLRERANKYIFMHLSIAPLSLATPPSAPSEPCACVYGMARTARMAQLFE